MIETALHARFASRGATQAADRGVVLPRHFGDPELEYRALREGAAVVDLGFRTIVRATGPDRVTFLQGMLTNDIAAIPLGKPPGAAPDDPGSGSPRTCAAGGGRRRAPSDVDAARADATAALEKLIIADDVELTASSEAVIGVEGPRGRRSSRGCALDARAARRRLRRRRHHVPHVDPASVVAFATCWSRPVPGRAAWTLEGRRVEEARYTAYRYRLDMDESTLASRCRSSRRSAETKRLLPGPGGSSPRHRARARP
jgi:folate-binding Fe-S cluster repair protein YgfZ